MCKNIKFELKLEDYLVTLIDHVRSNMIRLRLSNHKMPIETGRHIGIDRLCHICKSSDIGDEYELLNSFVCINSLTFELFSYMRVLKTPHKKNT